VTALRALPAVVTQRARPWRAPRESVLL